MVLKEHGLFRVWHSYRGEHYRMGYAESLGGEIWHRKDNELQWHPKSVDLGNFDNVMQEYAFIFDVGQQRCMLFNGNGFGKSGIGVTIFYL